jgi:hypothetical protein
MSPQEQDPLSLRRLLEPAPHDLLMMRPASPLVNSVMNERPALLEVNDVVAPPHLLSSTRGKRSHLAGSVGGDTQARFRE